MTQKDKELLLTDLCARLPYGVKCKIGGGFIGYDVCTIFSIESIGYIEIVEDCDTNGINIEMVKPYLFPLSSMTKEQKEEYHNLCSVGTDECGDIIYFNTYESIDYLNKNKFDYRYLIPMGLAEDATNLNIY